jgi:hypothetical protein
VVKNSRLASDGGGWESVRISAPPRGALQCAPFLGWLGWFGWLAGSGFLTEDFAWHVLPQSGLVGG